METGKVKYFNETKGFGFITNDRTSQDVFVHISGLAKGLTTSKLQDGLAVQFEVEQGKKGPNAVNVTPV